MKKIFLTRRNALLSSTGISWGTSALIFAILVLLLRFLAPNLFWYVFSPALNASNTLADKSHAFIAGFGDTAALAIRNEELTDENTALAAENAALVKQVADISALEASKVSGVIAAIAARPPESPYDTLLVAAGSNDDVTVGMEAFGVGGVPIGVVSEVWGRYARVTLFSAPRMLTSGWVGRANVPISIRGEGGGAVSASVSRSAQIAEGDIVYAPGPGMLTVGSVSRVDSDPSSTSVTLRIQPALNLFSIGWVTLRDTGITAFTMATSTSL